VPKEWFSFRAPAELAQELRSEATDRGLDLTAVIVERLEGTSRFRTGGPSGVQDINPALSERLLKKTEAAEPCYHPKDRQRRVTKGVVCLDCRAVRKTNEQEWV
jgi:hypothetical protein